MEPSSIGEIVHFFRLIEAQREFTQLLERLRMLRRRIDETRHYLGHPGCNPLLARTYREQTESERERALIQLRVVRTEICEILRLDPQAIIPRID